MFVFLLPFFWKIHRGLLKPQKNRKNDWLENPTNWVTDVYLLLKMVIFQPSPYSFSISGCTIFNLWTNGPRWWQLKYFWNFNPDLWGNDRIWRAYFANGLKPPARLVNFFYCKNKWSVVSDSYCEDWDLLGPTLPPKTRRNISPLKSWGLVQNWSVQFDAPICTFKTA